MALGGKGLGKNSLAIGIAVSRAAEHVESGISVRLRLGKELLLGDRGCFVEVELLGVFGIQVGHKDLQSLVFIVLDNTSEGGDNASRDLGPTARADTAARSGGAWRREGVGGGCDVEVPVVAVHLANHVGTAVLEHAIQKGDLVPPALVGATLPLGEQEVLAAVEDPQRSSGNLGVLQRSDVVVGETSLGGGNAEHQVQTEQQSSGTTGLENDLVGKHKHAGLGKEVGVHILGVDDRQDLAVNQVKHRGPGVRVDGLQATLLNTSRESLGARRKPDLKELLGAFESVGGVKVGSDIVVDGKVGGALGRGEGVVGGNGGNSEARHFDSILGVF